MPPLSSSPELALQPVPTLSQRLSDTARSATLRADEGQQVFGPVAALWDSYLQTDEVRKLPARLRRPITALCAEIAAIAGTHFDAYIRGIQPSKARPQDTPSTGSNSSPSTPETPKPTVTYADSAAAGHSQQPTNSAKRTPPLKTTPVETKTLRPDTRLFVQIAPDHKAREAGHFALFILLKHLLRDHAHLLTEVQAVKSGFALCTASLEDLTSLETHTQTIMKAVPGCTVERQPQWTNYRLDNIPRSVKTLNGIGQVENNTITGQYLCEALLDSIKQAPIRAVETRKSAEDGLFNTSWLVSFETKTHQPLPKNLRILGSTAVSSVIISTPKVIQCTRCFLWHNTRSCSRALRCRICGTCNHTEENHTTRCVTSPPHTCPARCYHCGGPHTADDPSCTLRPSYKNPKTKSQKEALTRASKAARARACVAKCSKHLPTDTQMNEDPQTPVRKTPVTPSESTVPSTRFHSIQTNQIFPLNLQTNRFSPLDSNE